MAEEKQQSRAEIRRRKKTRVHNLIFGLTLGIVTAVTGILLGNTDYIKSTELIALDFRYRNRPTVDFRKDLGYIDYDDESLALYGAWPWPRYRQVALVKSVAFYGGNSVGYDVFYTEPGNTVFRPEVLGRLTPSTSTDSAPEEQISAETEEDLQSLEEQTEPTTAVEDSGEDDDDWDDEDWDEDDWDEDDWDDDDWGDEVGTAIDTETAKKIQLAIDDSFRDYDIEFEESMLEAKNVFLAQIMELPDATLAAGGLDAINNYAREAQELFTEGQQASLEVSNSSSLRADSAMERGLYKAKDIVLVLPGLAEAAAGIGYAQIIKDLDPTVRLYPLFIYYYGRVYPSIASVMLASRMNVPMETIKIVPGEYVEFPDAEVPLEPEKMGTPTTETRKTNIRI
ncbi:MAG: CHASE2 domain-containing protein, partial [Candidatus Lindowbacteria bacterium]|nr:CHASE2 domain-containing protein [Candidatus Lindowbacteria bacterium]